jgi:hypothetical protein
MLQFLQDIVRQPRNTKVDFSLKLNDVTGSVAPVQTDVTLTVTRQSTSPASAALAASSSSTVRGRMIHSESTPVLDGAWSTRQLEHAVPAINNRFYQGKQTNLFVDSVFSHA